jgi:hypothetical protein
MYFFKAELTTTLQPSSSSTCFNPMDYWELTTTYILHYINPVMERPSFFFWILDPWRWDRYFVLHRKYEIATTVYIKAQKNAVLSSCAHLWVLQKNQSMKDSPSSCYYCGCTLNILLLLHSLSMEDKVFWLEFIDAKSVLVTWHAPHALTWTWPNTRWMFTTWA